MSSVFSIYSGIKFRPVSALRSSSGKISAKKVMDNEVYIDDANRMAVFLYKDNYRKERDVCAVRIKKGVDLSDNFADDATQNEIIVTIRKYYRFRKENSRKSEVDDVPMTIGGNIIAGCLNGAFSLCGTSKRRSTLVFFPESNNEEEVDAEDALLNSGPKKPYGSVRFGTLYI